MVITWMKYIFGGYFLAAAEYTIRSTYHTPLNKTPALLTLGRDMLLPHNFKVDWEIIDQNRQKEMSHDNKRENASGMLKA
jgi:hypothetical protein